MVKKVGALTLWVLMIGFAVLNANPLISISDPVTGKNGLPTVVLDPTTKQCLVVWLNKTDQKLFTRIVKGGGAVVGTPTLISTARAGQHYAVAFNSAAKEFLVVWETATTGGGSTSLYVQRVSILGARVGNPVKIAGQPQKLNWRPALAYNATDDNYLVVWSKEGLLTLNADELLSAPDGIYGRFIGSNGKPITTETLIREMSYQEKDGYLWHLGYQGFCLRWSAAKNKFALLANHVFAAQEQGNEEIVIFFFTSSGVTASGPTKINKTVVGSRSIATSLAENTTTGQWMAAWENIENEEGLIRGSIFTRPIAIGGSPIGIERQTFWNEEEAGLPSLAFNPDKGNYLLVLDADGDLGPNVRWDVYGQFLAADGSSSGRVLIIAYSKATSNAEHALLYNPFTKNFFIPYASVAGTKLIKIFGTFVGAQ